MKRRFNIYFIRVMRCLIAKGTIKYSEELLKKNRPFIFINGGRAYWAYDPKLFNQLPYSITQRIDAYLNEKLVFHLA